MDERVAELLSDSVRVAMDLAYERDDAEGLEQLEQLKEMLDTIGLSGILELATRPQIRPGDLIGVDKEGYIRPYRGGDIFLGRVWGPTERPERFIQATLRGQGVYELPDGFDIQPPPVRPPQNDSEGPKRYMGPAPEYVVYPISGSGQINLSQPPCIIPKGQEIYVMVCEEPQDESICDEPLDRSDMKPGHRDHFIDE